MYRLFVYGTLMDQDTRNQVLQRDVSMNSYKMSYAKLEGLIYNKNYKTVEFTQSSRDVIYGGIIMVSDDDIIRLDRYETSMYKRYTTRSGLTMYVENIEV